MFTASWSRFLQYNDRSSGQGVGVTIRDPAIANYTHLEQNSTVIVLTGQHVYRVQNTVICRIVITRLS